MDNSGQRSREKEPAEKGRKVPVPRSAARGPVARAEQSQPASALQAVRGDATPSDIRTLQRSIGNRATTQLIASRRDATPSSPSTAILPIQPKLLVGHASDAYEVEADRVAQTVTRSPEPLPAITPNSRAGEISRQVDESLQAALEKVGGYTLSDPFMHYSEAKNTSGKDVDWKAHVGVSLEDRAEVMARAGALLRKHSISHKFDIKVPEPKSATAYKFLTIYPPEDAKQWKSIIAEMESSLEGIETKIEGTEMLVMSGKVGMRHGQINALTADSIAEAGIDITAKRTEGPIQWYSIADSGRVADPTLQHRLLYHADKRAFFLWKAGQSPYPAIIWEGKLRPDPRQEWNPFGASLPPGVQTTDEKLWEEKAATYRNSSSYQKRGKALEEKRGYAKEPHSSALADPDSSHEIAAEWKATSPQNGPGNRRRAIGISNPRRDLGQPHPRPEVVPDPMEQRYRQEEPREAMLSRGLPTSSPLADALERDQQGTTVRLMPLEDNGQSQT